MKKNTLILKIIVFTAVCGIFLCFNSVFAATCREKYLDSLGSCASECSTLGSDYQLDSNPGLCGSGEVCCHKTASTTDAASQLELQIPLFDYAKAANLPEYLMKIYQYTMIVIVPLAIIMIIIGGIMWISAAGAKEKITGAKKYIINAFIGLGIALFSYIFLSFVGIETLTMPGIQSIKPIEGIPLEMFNQIMSSAGLPPTSTNPSECNAVAEQVAKENGIHPCFFVAILAKESGCKANAVGHDENAPNSAARKRFGSGKNTDKMCATPPKYCLDWRWSHGFGISQYTIGGTVAANFPWCAGADTPSRKESWIRGGACITVPQIFDIKMSLGIMTDYIKHFNGPSNPRNFFLRYNGSEAYADSATAIFKKCCQERGGC